MFSIFSKLLVISSSQKLDSDDRRLKNDCSMLFIFDYNSYVRPKDTDLQEEQP